MRPDIECYRANYDPMAWDDVRYANFPAAGACSAISAMCDAYEEIELLLYESRSNDMASMRLVADCRFAVGDDGKRMFPEFVEYLNELKKQRDELLLVKTNLNQQIAHFKDELAGKKSDVEFFKKQRDELLAALVAFRDGGPEGGNNFKEWHESYIPAPMYEEIWLQCPNRDSMSEWYGEVTWCQDQQNDDDTKYVRADLFAATEQQRDELLKNLRFAVDLLSPIAGHTVQVDRMRAAISSAQSNGHPVSRNFPKLPETAFPGCFPFPKLPAPPLGGGKKRENGRERSGTPGKTPENETAIPAIVFYPAGSLGEEVE